MTGEAQDQRTPTPEGPAWEAARRAGLDMDLIEDCLRLTPSERLWVHALACMTAEELRQAMRKVENAAGLTSPVPPGR